MTIKSNCLHLALAVVSTFLAACADPASPRSLGGRASQTVARQADSPETTDALLLRLAEDVPTLSGLWIDSSGTLNVALTSLSDSTSARIAVEAVRRLQRFHNREFAYRTASYTFQQIHAWRGQVADSVTEIGVEFFDADERRGRVVVGINSRASSAALRAKVPSSIPEDAVELRLMEPLRMMQTLQDSLRPVRGGARVTWIRDGGQNGGQCTLGFNVRHPSYSNWFAITNSHCGDMGVYSMGTPTQLHQPLDFHTLWPTQIGTEIADIPFAIGVSCPVARYCRSSDAAVFEYTSDSYSGGFTYFRTTEIGGRSGASINIHGTTPTIGAVDDDESTILLSGQVLDKIGQTTGWTRGQISITDAQIPLDNDFPGQHLMLEHSYYVEACSLGGDSGAPVFEYYGSPGSGLIYGMLWGGGGTPGSTCYYTFSLFSLMRAELGFGLAGT